MERRMSREHESLEAHFLEGVKELERSLRECRPLQEEIEKELKTLGGGLGARGESRRPHSWAAPELSRRTPLLKDYEEAVSSLLWQPYELQVSSGGDRGQREGSRRTRPRPTSVSQVNNAVDAMSGPPTPGAVSIVQVTPPERTYTSTEAQTEDPPPPPRPPQHQRRRRHRLPDLLDSHLPPPYTQPPPPAPPPPPLPLPFHIVPSRRRASVYGEVPKSCCGLLSPAAVSLRWLMLLLLTVGVCCALVGTVLGATRATAPHHLTVALLMIGVGVVLVTVSGVAWRLMAQEGPPCRAMLGLSSSSDSQEANRRFLPRLPPSYGRPHHPYAAMMYPEFQYRAPPPSYQASMQEYRLRLLLLDRHGAASPPPTYRSHPSTLLRGGLGLGRRELCSPPEYSRPPSYRSRTSTELTPHSRQVSQLSTCANNGTTTVTQIKEPLPNKENAVTIVQSCEEPTGPVIVTISGPETLPVVHTHHDQMEILAHL